MSGLTWTVAVALEVHCQANAGELDLHERLRFAAERAPLCDSTTELPVDLMLRLSDNAATNVLLHRVTRERVMARLTSLGLARIRRCRTTCSTRSPPLQRGWTSWPRRSGSATGARTLGERPRC
jgi:beta-lactamase class A